MAGEDDVLIAPKLAESESFLVMILGGKIRRLLS